MNEVSLKTTSWVLGVGWVALFFDLCSARMRRAVYLCSVLREFFALTLRSPYGREPACRQVSQVRFRESVSKEYQFNG